MKLKKLLEYNISDLPNSQQEVINIIKSLEQMGFKKYQLGIKKRNGNWAITLPAFGIGVQDAVKMSKFLPKNAVFAYVTEWKEFIINTGISIKGNK